MPEITQLSQSVVNKIAAGEVIERPASVLKELLENALDAGAKRIDVAIEQGGMDLVRVADDGCGMRPDQLPLAIASHATSKLTTADDLFRVRTFGFRGEALASIAEVSRFILRSRAESEAAGAELQVLAGEPQPIGPCGCPRGTTVEVRNLFCNTPVRRKFIRSPQTELGHVIEAFTRIALPHPQVHFTIRHNQRVVHDLPPVEDWLGRIVPLLGKELADQMLWVDSRDGDFRISGYVAHPSQSRSHNKLQYLFLNGRFIRDRSLQHALTEAYRGLLTVGRHPICCLKLEMPPDQVDVNVHPTKMEVRFIDGSRHYSQLLGTLRTRFLSTNLTHSLTAGRGPFAAATPQDEAAEPAPPAYTGLAQHAAQARENLNAWARKQLVPDELPEDDATAPPRAALEAAPRAPLQLHRFTPPTPYVRPEPPRREEATAVVGSQDDISQADTSQAREVEPADSPRPASPAGPAFPEPLLRSSDAAAALDPPEAIDALQLGNRYLVTIENDSVVIVDQHALHERVLYEKMRARVATGALERQRLLVPELVTLGSEEAAALLQQRELLERLGFTVEDFGESTLAVSAYPAMLGRESTVDLIRELAGVLLAGGKQLERAHLLDSLLHDLACKAAVKSGDRLSGPEIQALLAERQHVRDSHHCPHGRPTILVFTREQLDRQFKRT